jgi:iturin family lipopeptide synthetase B
MAMIPEEMRFPDLRMIDFGGEAVLLKDIELFRQHCPERCCLVNGLGATELNVIRQYVIDRQVADEMVLDGNVIPVGYAVPDTKVVLLDEDGKPLRFNQPGEMVIRSDYLSPGYWGLEEQTRKAFREGENDHAGRCFYTGDLARRRPDGCMEHMGRRDLQIKVRGIRIEPSEIEARILELPDIEEVVVVDRRGEKGNVYLAAFMVSAVEPDMEAIKSQLREKLPAYMIPTYFTRIERLPLTVTGKVDRRALKEQAIDTAVSVAYMEPENEVQRRLVEIWQAVLGVEAVGIMDGFFELGGDSIKAVQIVQMLSAGGYSVRLQDIAAAQTIKTLSQKIKPITEVIQYETIIEAPISATQRLYFCDEQYPHDQNKRYNFWNMSAMIYKKSRFKEPLVRETFRILLEYHEQLRVVFPYDEAGVRQHCRSADEEDLYGFHRFDLRSDDNYRSTIEQEAGKIQRMHDLTTGPVLQAAHFSGPDRDYLLFTVHHIACDLLSSQILMQDFGTVYAQLEQGVTVRLPVKSAPFLHWSNRMDRAAHSDEINESFAYWKRTVETPICPLPVDQTGSERLHRDVRQVVRTLPDKHLMKRIKERYHVAEEVIGLTALGRAVKRWCAVSLLMVNLATNGRMSEFGEVEVSRTVGWFSSSFPFVVDCSQEEAGDNLQRVSQARGAVPGDGSSFYMAQQLTLPQYPGEQWPMRKEIYFNFFGERQSGNTFFAGREEDMGFSDIPVGVRRSDEQTAEYKLVVLFSIVDGEVQMVLEYADTEYQRETMERLADMYVEEIQGLRADKRPV